NPCWPKLMRLRRKRSCAMNRKVPASDADLARAKNDPDFRRRLLADSLHLLLGELHKLNSANDAGLMLQICEGAELAVALARLLQANEAAVETHLVQAAP